MRKLILSLLLVSSCLLVLAQKKQTFFVEYLLEQKRISTSLPDSVREKKVQTTVYTINNGDTTKTDTIEMNIGDLMGSTGFSLTFYTLSNKDMSKTFYTLGKKADAESDGDISVTVNIPVDTIFYDRKSWYEMSEGSLKEIEPASAYYTNISFMKTSETKEILGYKCFKFVSSGKDKDRNISFWASKDLPATLIPHAGINNSGYGILQVDNPEKSSVTTATKITRL